MLESKEILVYLRELNNTAHSIEGLLKLFKKEILTLSEAAQYLGISTSTLRHYTSDNIITHYNPNNKIIYFRKEDLIQFMLQGRVEANAAIEQKAINHL